MKAEYDSQADALLIRLGEVERANGGGDQVHDRAVVAIGCGRPIGVQLLYPSEGIDEPLEAVAQRYRLDLQELQAAARSALAAPNRSVTIEVAAAI